MNRGTVVNKFNKQADLDAAMKKRNWDQPQAAEFLGMCLTKFNRMINQKALPIFTPELVSKLVELTGKSPEELFSQELLESDSSGKRLPTTASVVQSCTSEDLVCSGVRCRPNRSAQEIIEMMDEIRTLLSKIPLAQAEAVRYHYLMGHTLEDTAKILGVSREAVRQRVQKAMIKLQEIGRHLQ